MGIPLLEYLHFPIICQYLLAAYLCYLILLGMSSHIYMHRYQGCLGFFVRFFQMGFFIGFFGFLK